MENHKIQNQFDENSEWDSILEELNLAPKRSSRRASRASMQAEAALIADTEEYNALLADVDKEAQKFQVYVKRETAQRSLLDRQRRIISDNQKRVERDIEQTRMEIERMEQMVAREKHWRAERDPISREQNRLRSLETKIALQSDDTSSHSFHSQNEELEGLGARVSKVSTPCSRRNAVPDTDSDSDSEDGGVPITVVTKCETPNCEQCRAARANIKLEAPDSSLHFDGGAIIPVITDRRTPDAANADWEDLDPNDRDAYTEFSTPSAQSLPKAKSKGKKPEILRLAIDWNVHGSHPTSESERESSPLDNHEEEQGTHVLSSTLPESRRRI
ncbi:hypothetical protein L207DRAFT_532366 [Hyaloscypha variabilis F]|uniref:Uncharacterized protein n=1 Tax=Hyaloscypha variabilis (strain UAMH 11265 / GT02V1 / F) TaxID=1149755 RepID=A0A2J6RE21_HYAVF|nr:hypothetical protein L207DRAFT_532366 [Hyaloscypha variabilis F]